MAAYDRKADESDPAFEAFVLYRDAGVSRNTRSVAKELDKSHTIVGRWCTEHGWVKRARAWDKEVDRRNQLGQLKEVEAMRRRQIKMALSMQELGMIELEKELATAKRRKKKRGDLDEKTIVKLIDQGAKLERLNRGEPGEIVQSNSDGSVDLTGLTTAELRKLKEMRSKVRTRQLKADIESDNE